MERGNTLHVRSPGSSSEITWFQHSPRRIQVPLSLAPKLLQALNESEMYFPVPSQWISNIHP